MPLSAGTHLGPYQIVAPIGAGGMGEVYRAKDTRLDRPVAIKILPGHFSSDPCRHDRFEREARAISALNHPHICTLHDIGHQDGIDYLVMEYLEGQTVADRLRKGPLPPDQVLQYAIEIADALNAAHRHGVIHRDLKPGNIMLTKLGAKLLDFGLAKVAVTSAVAGVTVLTTQTTPLTGEGTILGTLQYMTPEQLEGKGADVRTDIFAFGAVAFEMAVGRPAFAGDSKASIIAAILNSEPPPVSTVQTLSNSAQSAALDRVVKKCLAKDPERRWQTAADLKDELAWIAEVHAPAQLTKPKSRVWIGWAVAAAIGIAIAVFAFGGLRSEINVPAVRFVVPVPFNRSVSVGTPSISPNGRLLAFVAPNALGRDVLWVRPLDGLSPQALPGTEGGSFPFWSPDSGSLGFFSAGKLKKIAVAGGLPQTVCDALSGWGGTWNRSGTIVFAASNRGPLYQVSASGGAVTPVTALDRSRGDFSHAWPQFLPDGGRFLYVVRSGKAESTGVYVGSLDAKASKLLVHTGFSVAYAPPQQRRSGYLLFLNNGALMAQRIDLGKLHLTAEPVRLIQRVDGTVLGIGGQPPFSVSENGVLAYIPVSATSTRLVWVDRKGNELGAIGPPGDYDHPELSPDETRIAVDRGDPRTGNRDIWLGDIARSAISRFTFDSGSAWIPVWSPDGNRIAFISEREGSADLYQKAAGGARTEEALFRSETPKIHSDWSADGRFIAFESEVSQKDVNIWVLPLFGDRKPIPFARSEFSEQFPRFSPDGKWIAYASDETGQFEVYVQSFPGLDVKRQISTNGGTQPRWRHDEKELFYIEDRKMMAVEVKPGPRCEVGMPKFLFETRMSGADPRNKYTVTAKGQRFLLNTPAAEALSSPIVVVNWAAALKQNAAEYAR